MDGQPEKCWQDRKKNIFYIYTSNQRWNLLCLYRLGGVFEVNVFGLFHHPSNQLTVQEILALVGERITGFCRYTVTSANSLCTCLWSTPCSVGLPSETTMKPIQFRPIKQLSTSCWTKKKGKRKCFLMKFNIAQGRRASHWESNTFWGYICKASFSKPCSTLSLPQQYIQYLWFISL